MKEDCIKMFEPGKTAYVYPEKRLITPQTRDAEGIHLEKVMIKETASDRIVLEDGRVYLIQNYGSNGHPLGGYLAVHRLTVHDLPDTVAFPSLEALQNEIEYQFIINKLVNFDKRWEDVPIEILRKIDQLLCDQESLD